MKLLILTLFFVFALTEARRPVVDMVPHGGRIIGGHLAKAGQFPFIAAIYILTPAGQFFCGGTILNERWVLTAAHCLNGATQLTIHFGITNLTKRDPNRVTVVTKTFTHHSGFNPATLTYDIGLVQLDEPLTFNEFIQPIQFLPITKVALSAPVIAIGWGLTSDSAPTVSNELYYVYLTTISNAQCKQTFGSVVQDYVVCVTGRTNEGACTGDSGGPLVQYIENGYYVHAGSLSFVSGRGCEAQDPSGYTKTFDFLDYINQVTGGL